MTDHSQVGRRRNKCNKIPKPERNVICEESPPVQRSARAMITARACWRRSCQEEKNYKNSSVTMYVWSMAEAVTGEQMSMAPGG